MTMLRKALYRFPALLMHAVTACAALASSRLDAQAAPAENWLMSAGTPGRPDTILRHVRVRWRGDSLVGDINGYEKLLGNTDGANVQITWITTGQPVKQVVGRRTSEGLIVGTWSTPGQSGRPGTWRAERMISKGTRVEIASAPYEDWTMVRPTFEGDSIPLHLRLYRKGDSLQGRIGPETGFVVGTVRDSVVRMVWLDNGGFVYRFTGFLRSDGTMQGPPPAGGPQRGGWRAERNSRRRAPRSVSYTPARTISHFSAGNDPAIRVVTGDTIKVRGLRGRAAAPPVYVEGAYRGDVLIVRILSMRISQSTAGMGTRLDTNWLTPDLIRAIPDAPFSPVTWTLDTIAGVAKINREMAGLGVLTIPLKPHIGMIAVAPAGQTVIPAGEEGSYGGNLDFDALGPGATIYLPVNHAGGLLSVGGDVHAAQGDGELALNGLETDADFDYTVEVLEGRGLEWIRAENATHLMAFGSSEDLNVALRVAVGNLVKWLNTDLGLDDRETAVLLGAAAELKIANVFGTQRTIVAMVNKALIPGAGSVPANLMSINRRGDRK